VKPIILSTALTEQDWLYAVRLARRWYYWPLRLLSDVHGYAFLYLAIVCAGAVVLYPAYRTQDVLLGIPVCLAIGLVLLWITGLLRKRSVRKKVRRHNAKASKATIFDGGIMFGGAVIPWKRFRSAVVGDGLVVLRLAKRRKAIQTFAIASLSSIQREELIATLRHNLGPRHMKEASIRGSRLRPNVIRQR